jgi:hypothetical protein
MPMLRSSGSRRAERRLGELKSGKVVGIPAQKVMKRVCSTLR